MGEMGPWQSGAAGGVLAHGKEAGTRWSLRSPPAQTTQQFMFHSTIISLSALIWKCLCVYCKKKRKEKKSPPPHIHKSQPSTFSSHLAWAVTTDPLYHVKLKTQDSAASLRASGGPAAPKTALHTHGQQLGQALPSWASLMGLFSSWGGAAQPCHQQITALTGLTLQQQTLNCLLLFTPEFIVG